jgi:hypothetical protein
MKKLDYDKLDWGKTDLDLALEHGRTKSVISRKRKELGIKPATPSASKRRFNPAFNLGWQA